MFSWHFRRAFFLYRKIFVDFLMENFAFKDLFYNFIE